MNIDTTSTYTHAASDSELERLLPSLKGIVQAYRRDREASPTVWVVSERVWRKMIELSQFQTVPLGDPFRIGGLRVECFNTQEERVARALELKEFGEVALIVT
jgi:hypothetical protein